MIRLSSNQNPIQLIKQKKTSETCFIIGGGPSVSKYLSEVSLLAHKDIIVTNNAYKLFPDALHCHFGDKIWWSWHSPGIEDVFNSTISTSTIIKTRQWEEAGVFSFIKQKNTVLELHNQNALGGSNAGHQAINLAIHCGYKNIVLIGFDMNTDGTPTHWHSEHKRPDPGVDNMKRVIIPGFFALAEVIPDGVSVYNINPESALTCFEYKSLSDCLSL